MLVLGHRGDPSAAMENTLAAVDAALRGGADGIECDLRSTADGAIVLLHDVDLVRVAGVNRSLRRMRMAELKRVSLLDGERVPTLAQLLDLARSHAHERPVWLDLESKEAGIAERVVAELHRHADAGVHVLITSFDAREVRRAAATEGPHATGLLDRGRRPSPLRTARWCRASWTALPDGSPARVARARAAGFKTLVWSVDDPVIALRYRDMGVEALCTNRPRLMRRVLTAS